MVQWLRLHASTAGDTGLIPGQGTKIPHAVWHSQKIKSKLKKICFKLKLLFIEKHHYANEMASHKVREVITVHLSDKGFAIIHKECLQINREKSDNPVGRWSGDSNWHFTKQDAQMTNKHTKRYIYTHIYINNRITMLYT